MDIKDKISILLLELGYTKGQTWYSYNNDVNLIFLKTIISENSVNVVHNYKSQDYTDSFYTYDEYYNMLLGELRKQKINKLIKNGCKR